IIKRLGRQMVVSNCRSTLGRLRTGRVRWSERTSARWRAYFLSVTSNCWKMWAVLGGVHPPKSIEDGWFPTPTFPQNLQTYSVTVLDEAAVFAWVFRWLMLHEFGASII